jgi:hypothetical protein
MQRRSVAGHLLHRLSGKLTWIIIAAALLSPVWAQTGISSLAPLSDAVLHKGPAGQLPAHLSVVLGIAKAEEPVPVKQAVVRNANTVRTFNVCTANHDDVVMLTYDEQSHATKVYLVSVSGVLRKAVRYQAGGAAEERALIDARRDFEGEIKFWTDFEHQSARPE